MSSVHLFSLPAASLHLYILFHSISHLSPLAMSSRPASALPQHLAHFRCCGLRLPSAQASIKGLQSPSPPKDKASTATLHSPCTLLILGYMLNTCPQPGHPAHGINAHSPPYPKPTQCPWCILHCAPPPSALIPPRPLPHFILSRPSAA